jgi:hypothetical protein
MNRMNKNILNNKNIIFLNKNISKKIVKKILHFYPKKKNLVMIHSLRKLMMIFRRNKIFLFINMKILKIKRI